MARSESDMWGLRRRQASLEGVIRGNLDDITVGVVLCSLLL